MDEQQFSQMLHGYEPINPPELLDRDFVKGGHMRYAIDTLSQRGRRTHTSYKKGGVLVHVDPDLRFIRLINPYSKKEDGRPFVWVVKLRRSETERVRLWYKPRCTTDEVVTFRELVKQLNEGKIRIVRTGR